MKNILQVVDEMTLLIFDENNRHSLGFSGTEDIKNVDVVSGGEGLTMFVQVMEGRDSRIAPPFIVFQKKDQNYPIHIVPGNKENVGVSNMSKEMDELYYIAIMVYGNTCYHYNI